MKHVREAVRIAVVSATLLAGCTSPEKAKGAASNTSSSPSPATAAPQPGVPTTEKNMSVKFVLTAGADPKLAALQESVGNVAAASIVGTTTEVSIDGQQFSVRMDIPHDPVAQQQGVVITHNSQDSGKIFAQLGIARDANVHGSLTDYSVTGGPSGVIQESGPSLSVVGQETNEPGVFQETATELCQGLEATGSPTITSTNIYRLAKEAICNSLGIAADSKILGQTYVQYEARLAGQTLSPSIEQGSTVPYPIMPQQLYDKLHGANG